MAVTRRTKSHPLEPMAKLPLWQRNAILAGVALVTILVFWFTLYSGVRTEIQQLEARLSNLHGDLSKSRSIASNLATFEAKQKELRAELDAALQRLPNEKELPLLLTDISSLGKKSGLEIRSFRPEDEIAHGFYAEVPIRIEFLGSYHEAAVFFDRLSRLSRIVNITEMTMGPARDSHSDPPQLTVKGIATTFRFVEEAGGGGA
ncbi:MAG: type 4a pilus biogenesis protein PilO [Myxococcota bacterium]